MECVTLTTKVVKSRTRGSLFAGNVDTQTTHNDSLLNRSFLPSAQERNLSRINTREDNSVQPSRNISKELFHLPNMSSQFTKSKMSVHSKSGMKTHSRIVKRLKTPDIKLTNIQNDSKVATEESPERTEIRSNINPLIYRSTEFR